MTLLEVLVDVVNSVNGASQLTDMVIGTVTSVSPLEITIDVSQAAIKSEIIYLTDAVIEKKLSTLSHTHTVSGSTGAGGSPSHSHGVSLTTSDALGNTVCTENGVALPYDASGITLNRGLAVGDKVLMLSVQHGQKYVVLSRLF